MEYSLDNPRFLEAIAGTQDVPRSSGSSTSSGLQQRSCSKCPSRMSSIDRDKHLFCIKCRGFECSVELRCDECKDWSKEEMLAHEKICKSLASKSKSRGKSSSNSKSSKKPASPPSTSVPLDIDDRLKESVNEQDRDSQILMVQSRNRTTTNVSIPCSNVWDYLLAISITRNTTNTLI